LPSNQILRSLIGLVLLFDFYSIYQQLRIQRMRRQLLMRDELFRLIGENAADMIAVVDSKGIAFITALLTKGFWAIPRKN